MLTLNPQARRTAWLICHQLQLISISAHVACLLVWRQRGVHARPGKHVWEFCHQHLKQLAALASVGPSQDDWLQEGLLNTAAASAVHNICVASSTPMIAQPIAACHVIEPRMLFFMQHADCQSTCLACWMHYSKFTAGKWLQHSNAMQQPDAQAILRCAAHLLGGMRSE
jgi:hypothetical protein